MIREERCNKIVEYVDAHQYASMSKLISLVNSSKSTIRRDLLQLSEEGKINFVRGGAASVKNLVMAESLYMEKSAKEVDEKKRIGEAAASLLKDNDVAFIASGTTTRSIIPNIDTSKNLHIMTNDIMIAMDLSDNESVEVLLTGGRVRDHYYSLLGYRAEDSLSTVQIGKCFLGCDAIDIDRGCFIANSDEIGINRKIVESSQQIIILADHTKFHAKSFACFCEMKEIDVIITDVPLSKEDMKKCEEAGVEVIIA